MIIHFYFKSEDQFPSTVIDALDKAGQVIVIFSTSYSYRLLTHTN